MEIGAMAAIGLAAAGSALGTGSAAQGAVGAFKKSFLLSKVPPSQLIIYTAFPLSQTIYGIVLMFTIMGLGDGNAGAKFAAGLFGGLAMGFSAALQGKVMAGACDSLVETGKGNAYYIILAGIVESVAVFVLALLIVALT